MRHQSESLIIMRHLRLVLTWCNPHTVSHLVSFTLRLSQRDRSAWLWVLWLCWWLSEVEAHAESLRSSPLKWPKICRQNAHSECWTRAQWLTSNVPDEIIMTYHDVLYAEGNERDSNHQQIQQIKVISAESPFMKESTKRCHLMNTTETSELNKHLQQ